MAGIVYKYNIGDTVQLKMAFTAPSCGLANMAGVTAKIIDRRDYNGPCYKLKGYQGFFQEGTIFALVEAAPQSAKPAAEMSDEELTLELRRLQEEADKRNTKAKLAAWSAVVNAVEHWLQNYSSLAIDCESATICLSTIDSINYEEPGRIYRCYD